VYWVEQAAQQADADRCRRFTIEHRISPRILVTGGTGFLGRALMDRLRQQGELVRMLVRRPDKKLENDPFIDVVYGDLGTPEPVDEAMRGIELVYHVGAAMRGGAAEFERGTVWGTWNVVDACLRHGVKRLVHVSSLSVLDHAGHLPGVPVDENSALEPDAKRRGFYTQTKLEAERIVLEACRNRNLPAVILRPGQICGPGVERMPPSGTIALAGRWLVVGNGEHPVPFVYVDDVVDAILAAAQRPDVLGEVFQLVDPEQVTQREYAELCRRRFGSELRVVYVPKPTLMALSAGVELLGRMLRRNVPLTRYRVESIRPLWPCNCDKAREGLGWAPRTGVREGFRRMYGDKLHRR
jgi:nucleoside-diphosphate-sugar epimerase